MQKKQYETKAVKRITALLMSGILLMTSMPLMTKISAAGADVLDPTHWDPAPYFNVDARKTGATAWYETDEYGDEYVVLKFPKATGGETSFQDQATKKDIQNYLIEISVLGKQQLDITKPEEETIKTVYQNIISGAGMSMFAAEPGAEKMIYAAFTTEEINSSMDAFVTSEEAEKFKVTQNSPYRFNVRITAIDSENWFSLPLDTILTPVPLFEYEEVKYKPINETNVNALREVARFEGENKGKSEFSRYPNAATEAEKDQVFYDGFLPAVGAPYGSADTSSVGKPSTAASFRIDKQVTGDATVYDTTASREAYDFYGAEEAWFWFDCSDVTLQGVSVRLRPNEKMWKYKVPFFGETYADYPNGSDQSGAVYSTKGLLKTDYDTLKASGKTIRKQRADGGWEEITLNFDAKGQNPTFDLNHFKGYIRVPIEMICAEEDVTVTGSNNNQTKLFDAWDGKAKNNKNFSFSSPQVLNPKGTPINKAYHRQRLKINGNAELTVPAIGIRNVENSDPEYSVKDNPYETNKSRSIKWNKDKVGGAGWEYKEANARTEHGVKKEGAFRAIEDIYTVGFAFKSCTNDSVKHRFFFDNVMFYKSDGIYTYDPEVSGSTEDHGKPLNTYYNQKLDRVAIVLDTIDKMIMEPSWTDYKQVEYINKMIAGFHTSFGASDTMFVDTPIDIVDGGVNPADGMTAAAKTLGRLDSWAKYRAARKACLSFGTAADQDGNFVVHSNADYNDLLPAMIDIMEKLPPVAWMVSPTEEQLRDIVKLYQSYVLLNRTQLEAMGTKEKTDLFSYIQFLGQNSSIKYAGHIVGEALAEEPFLPFCDFNKVPTGTKFWPVEDDKASYYAETLPTSVRHNKGLTLWNSPYNKAAGANTFGRGILLTDAYGNGDTKLHTATANIRSNGFMGTNAANVTAQLGMDDHVHSIIVTRDGLDYAGLDAMHKNGCGQPEQQFGNLLLNTKGHKYGANDEANKPPLSLIFYVDFTEFKPEDRFYFIPAVYTKEDDEAGVDAYDKCVPSMGGKAVDQKYFILDPNDGTWKQQASGETSCFRSFVEGNTINLAGFKGYIRIPFYHFKGGHAFNGQPAASVRLDATAKRLDNIFAIQFGVGTDDGSINGKSFIIDNIGFTYDRDYYVNSADANSQAKTRNDKTYEELYGVKARPAETFEYNVDELDPFYSDVAAMQGKIEACIKEYQGLTPYQKTLPSVKGAFKSMKNYANWLGVAWAGFTEDSMQDSSNDVTSVPSFTSGTVGSRPNAVDPFHTSVTKTATQLDAEKMTYKGEPLTLDAFKDYISTKFPTKAKDLSGTTHGVTVRDGATVLETFTKTNVRYPGFIVNEAEQTTPGTVNYGALGFTDKEQVDKILLLFEYGFSRLSWADQMKFQKAPELDAKTEADIWAMNEEDIDALPDSDTFISSRNAYRAAVRCKELEHTLEACKAMVNKTDGISTVKKDYPYQPEGTPTPPVENQPTFVTIAEKDTITTTFHKIYDKQPYYAKIAAEYGAVIPMLKNTKSAIDSFAVNASSLLSGTTLEIPGGLISLKRQYTALHEKVKSALAAGTLFTLEDLAELKTAIENYDNLAMRFHNVGELFTPIEHIKRDFPVVKTDATASTTLNLTDKNLTAEEANSYTVTYAVDIPEWHPGKTNVLAFTPTSATPKKLAGQEYTLTFDFGDGSSVTFDSSTFEKDQAVKIKEITPNVYGKTGTTQNSLAVKVTCTLKATPDAEVFAGQSSFTLGVMTETTEGGTTTLGAYKPAKNNTYATAVGEKAYTLQYSKGDTFEVSFPAQTNINWGKTEPVPVGYTVTTNMHDAASLKVQVADKKGVGADYQKLLLNGTVNEIFLTYTAAGFDTETTFKGTNTGATATTPATMTVDYTGKPLGDYSTTLTYTVTYNDGSAATPPTS